MSLSLVPAISSEQAQDLASKFLALGQNAPEETEPMGCGEPGCISGWVIVDGKGAKRCKCIVNKWKQDKLSVIPTVHASAILSQMKPAADRFKDQPSGHYLTQLQAKYLDIVRKNPDDNYIIYGPTGSGKSAIGYALYRRAVCLERPAHAFEISDYLANVRTEEFGNGLILHVSAKLDLDMLRQSKTRYFVFIDEITRLGTKVTDFAVDRIEELIRAVKEWNHQLVVTSIINPDDIAALWATENPRSAVSAVRRMLEAGVGHETRELSFF
jgi:hypothetical protein